MSATRELLTLELSQINEWLREHPAVIGEGLGEHSKRIQRRDEITQLLERLQPNDVLRDPRILRG